MPRKQRAGFGTWPSPWTAESVAAAEVRLSEVRLDGEDVYWIERRPTEGGRSVVVRRRGSGAVEDAIPAGANARNAVYEYGGGSYAVDRGTVFFSEFADGRVWVAPVEGEARPLTPAGPWRYADLTLDRAHRRLLAIQEDRSGEGEPLHRVVAIDLGPEEATAIPLVEGSDFYASPTPSPDGAAIAWLEWSHPDMPWDSTELWLAEVTAGGRLERRDRVAGGGVPESIREPRFTPRGALWFVSDRTGYWNLYELAVPAGGGDERAVRAVTRLEAEIGGPQWVFGESFYAFAGEDDVVFAANHRGVWRLHRMRARAAPPEPEVEDLSTRWSQLAYLRGDGGRAVFVGGSATEPTAVVSVELARPASPAVVLRRSAERTVDAAWISVPRTIELETAGGARAHGFLYAPAHPDFEGLEGERPPLIVVLHGGPTAGASTALAPGIQFWTSRGFAVLDLNYRGSTGFGRAYREALYGAWGVAEVDDCVAAVRHLALAGAIDPARAVIRGGSAGGYTALAALTFRSTFRAGASYYGIADLEALARDTHKFESRYCDRLIGPYPERRDLYRERSPLYATDRLSCPIIFFQGLEDRVVPPNQTELMVEALRRKGVPVAYVPFAGEQHGFRRAENIQRALECELYFYSRVFGFELPGSPPELLIENL